MRCFAMVIVCLSIVNCCFKADLVHDEESSPSPSLTSSTTITNDEETTLQQQPKDLYPIIKQRELTASESDPPPSQLQLLTTDQEGTDSSKENRRRKKKADRKKKKKRDKSIGSPQYQALKIWADSLTEADYNETHWRTFFHSRSSVDFFNGYARRISDIFKKVDAKVNFAMVGACDGTGDNTIKHLYLPNSHWRGVFVEPMGINVRDLIQYMSVKNAAHRSLIIRAAATSVCLNATLQVERPLYEEKNDSSIPHWLRRQIGSVLPTTRKHARKEWIIEEVRCVTAKDILSDWATAFNGGGGSTAGGQESESGSSGGGSGAASEEARQVKAMKAEQRR